MNTTIQNNSNNTRTLIVIASLFLSAFTFAQVGIGTTTPKSTLEVNGSIATKISNVNSNTVLNDSHSVVICDASSANVSLTLPAANTCAGRIYTIRKNDTSYNLLSFSPAIKSFDASYTSLNYQKTFKIQSDGTDWLIIE